MAKSIVFQKGEVDANITKLLARIDRNIPEVMDFTGSALTNHAKRTRSWTDRTTHARRSIHHEFHHIGNTAITSVGMGSDDEDYPKWLEIANGGKYRVIDPTVFGHGKGVFRDALKGIM